MLVDGSAMNHAEYVELAAGMTANEIKGIEEVLSICAATLVCQMASVGIVEHGALIAATQRAYLPALTQMGIAPITAQAKKFAEARIFDVAGGVWLLHGYADAAAKQHPNSQFVVWEVFSKRFALAGPPTDLTGRGEMFVGDAFSAYLLRETRNTPAAWIVITLEEAERMQAEWAALKKEWE
jgi:hypothetical protein